MQRLDLKDVEEYKEFRQPCGGFVVEIKGAEDVPEKQYLRLTYDIVQAYDPKDAEFVNMYTNRKNERGWDYPTTIVSYKQTALSMFKGFITAIKKSNNGYDFEATYNEAELVGKRFGAVIGLEEYMGKDKNGAPKVRTRPTIVARKSVDTILAGEFKVPTLKKLAQEQQSSSPFKKNTAQAQENVFSKPVEQAIPQGVPEAPTPQPVAQDMTPPNDDIPF